MSVLLERLCEGLTPADSAVVLRWLAGLSASTRRELANLWDERGDSCSRSAETLGDGRSAWHRLPIVRGRFPRPGEVADDEEWRADHFEYLLDHPEIWVMDQPSDLRRSFHIGCTAHRAARDVLKAGHIPADFACPLASAACPLRKLLSLAPGQSFHLAGPPKK
jgi:hypothetical protein